MQWSFFCTNSALPHPSLYANSNAELSGGYRAPTLADDNMLLEVFGEEDSEAGVHDGVRPARPAAWAHVSSSASSPTAISSLQPMPVRMRSIILRTISAPMPSSTLRPQISPTKRRAARSPCATDLKRRR